MTPVEFLRAVWPRTGIYCLATPAKVGWRHWTFDTIEAAASYIGTTLDPTKVDIYLNLHTLREKQVPHRDPVKRAEGKTQVRVKTNMVYARSFFLDIDIDPDHPRKYDTQVEALAALKAFVAATALPLPMVVSSGGGLHIYWRLTDDLESGKWRETATHLFQLTQHYGLKVDTSKVIDPTSLLRVAGTFNLKKAAPRPVEVLAAGRETGTGVFVKSVTNALTEAGVEAQKAPQLDKAESELGSNTLVSYDGPRPRMRSVLEACPQMARIGMLQGQFSEPEWYYGAIGVGRFTEESDEGVHKLSKGHSGYSRSECAKKIRQSESVQPAPTSCRKLAEMSDVGDSLCIGCPHQGKVFGPIQAALPRETIPAPQVTELVSGVPTQVTIPPPPKPYSRTKVGVVFTAKNADGVDETTVIYEYDLFPVKRVSNRALGREQHIWHVELEHNEAKDFMLDADTPYDQKKFASAIANQGIHLQTGQLPLLREYMIAYIRELQRLAGAEAQHNHVGWTESHEFILPDKILLPDGSSRQVQLSLGAQRATAAVMSEGTLERQVELLDFYNHPQYVPNQFMILVALGAPIFGMSGHHGAIVNASGESGASKSTTLYTAASMWGHPSLYTINGTKQGATAKAQQERVSVLANLPVCVDEITHMAPADAQDLAMGITQPGGRLRLQQDGVERAGSGARKASVLLTTANASLHALLSINNAAGTAGSMRVFEMIFAAAGVHTKPEADQFLFQLKENYGHIGPKLMEYVVPRREAIQKRFREIMDEVDRTLQITGAERFWSALIAEALTICEITNQLGLLRYPLEPIKRWLFQVQVPHMRGTVVEEYSDPLDVVSNYLNTISANTIVTKKFQGAQAAGVNIMRAPTGPLLAHYDLDTNVLYVLKKGFKDYCVKIGSNPLQVVKDLSLPREGGPIIPLAHTRRTLGAGTDFARAQAWCFAINMKHKAVSDLADLQVVESGGNQGGGTVGSVANIR